MGKVESTMTHMKNLTIWKERNKNKDKRSMLTTKNSVKLHYHNDLKLFYERAFQFLCTCIIQDEYSIKRSPKKLHKNAPS